MASFRNGRSDGGPKELSRTLQTEAGENVIIDLNIRKGGDSFQKMVMLKEIQIHPLRRKALHADFYEVSMEQMVTVEIPFTCSENPRE